MVFSLACDLIRLAGAPGDAWITVAYYSMVGGFIGALCAAVPGLIDLIYYKGGAAPVKKIALTHMTINLSVVALYVINIWLRAGEPSIKVASMSIPVLLSILGVALLCVSGGSAARWCMGMASAWKVGNSRGDPAATMLRF
ncbi:MAG TPA: DUF2231 domain-containing protein [Steroidobacteraceae bacterium]|jgi:uncharacterized membrane protein